MNPSKAVKICIGVVSATVVCMCGLNFSNTKDTENIKQLHQNVTQNYKRTEVMSRVKALSDKDSVDDPNAPGIPQSPDLSDWLECVRQCHILWYSQGIRYQWGGGANITNFDGSPIHIRHDCSGFVSFCLYTYGKAPSPTACDSGGPWWNYGLAAVDKGADGAYTYDELLPGDVVTWPGHHVQIYAGPTPEDNWYDWGSTRMIENAYAGQDVATANPISRSSRDLSGCVVYRLIP